MEVKAFREHLENNLIPFWNRLQDRKNGGFYGYADCKGTPDPASVKGVILNSRILWFYSSAYQLLQQPKLLEMADHAYRFLAGHCLDNQYGGVYWSVNCDGSVCDDTKHTYNQAFAIYALSAYYRAGHKEEALDLAYTLYRIMEEKCSDDGGYLEAFHRDFTPASNEKLSENGVLAERTMNTLLHVLEAYTGLYQADSSAEVGDSIRNILRLFSEKIYDSEKQICDVFFDLNYHSLIDLESFGHNIETSWLIDRGCHVLGDPAYKKMMQPMISGLAASAYRNAYDSLQHGLNNEREGNQIDRQKIWWVQAEAVVGFYNAWQRDPQKTEYLQTAEEIWQFIQHTVIDPESGEWIESIPPDDQKPDPEQALVHPWKCPYHNGRMCMEMIARLQSPVNLRATPKANALLRELHETAGKGIITGQHTQTNSMEEIAYIRQLTGKAPRLRGFELLSYSPNINYNNADEACLTEIYENRGTVDTALKWAADTGGIVALCFHWFSPTGGRDKSFYARNTDFDASRILIDKTPEREAFFRDMDVIAEQLKRFQAADIPVLWRPFHEADGDWFWWGAKGPQVARDLYRLMFDYYTDVHKINNLLWVWNCRLAEGYPGDGYVDVISTDIYLPQYEATDYRKEYLELIQSTTQNKVAALAEVGYLPDIHMLEQSHTPWAYYMTWSKEFCIGEQYNQKAQVQAMYASDYAITSP